MTKLDGFFGVRKNIFDRAKFDTRIQQPGESAEQFISALYVLADECNYEGLREQMIRDCIVVRRDAKLSRRMQIDSELDLEKAN